MPKTLLLADDSITIHKVVKLTFMDEDVVVEAVTRGDEVLEAAHRIRPDIVLADAFMPGLTGYQVCEQVKSDRTLCDTPVVLLVGTFEPFDTEEADRVSCDAHLVKPFDTSELIQVVRRLINRAASRSGSPSSPKGSVLVLDPAPPAVSSRTRESFLGAGKILDLFGSLETGLDPSVPAQETADLSTTSAQEERRSGHGVSQILPQSDPGPHVIPFPLVAADPPASPSSGIMSDDLIETVVRRVIERMSREVVQEVAWEVVPEMAEAIIRKSLPASEPQQTRA